MFKKLLLFLALFLLCLSAAAAAENKTNEISVYFNSAKVECDVSPFIDNDRALVPVRALLETFKYDVGWNNDAKVVSLKSKSDTIILTIDSEVAVFNGKSYIMDTKAFIKDDRTFVPIRFISENFGYNVAWSNADKKVLITNPPKAEPAPLPAPTPSASEKKYLNISNISADLRGDSLIIKVQADGKIDNFTTMRLESPERFAIDINNAVLTVTDTNEIAIKNSTTVSKVRFSQFSESPKTTRIVCDLKQKSDITTGYENGLFFIEISGIKAEAPNKKPEESPNISDPTKKVVVVDPGHGGTEPGSVGISGGKEIYEKDINLLIGNKVYEILKKKKINIIMTRTTDKTVELSERAEIANSAKADLFVSIHNNSFDDPSINGTLTMYAYDEPKAGAKVSGKTLADIMQKQLVKGTGGYDKKLLCNEKIYVLRRTNMPAILTECLFMSNAADLKELLNNDRITKIAESIADGIILCLEKV